jgi:hypothetical protein
MRRTLIILDGSDLPASILPAAYRYAGPGDELALACILQPTDLLEDSRGVDGHHPDLQAEIVTLRKSGVAVQAEILFAGDLRAATDKAIERFHPDMTAIVSRRTAVVVPGLAPASGF